MSKEILKMLSKSIIEGEKEKVVELTKEALKKGIPPNIVVQEGLIPGVKKVGELFNLGEYYLPEMIVSSNAMQAALGILEPLISGKRELFHSGKFLMATVKGDIHDIGKNIVVMMLKGNGWEVTDLGVDVDSEKICSAIRAGGYDILGLSTLLTVTMPASAKIIEAIKKEGLREKIKIMIGGAPVTQEFAEKIGADEYGKDAWEAVTKARGLIEKAR